MRLELLESVGALNIQDNSCLDESDANALATRLGAPSQTLSENGEGCKQ